MAYRSSGCRNRARAVVVLALVSIWGWASVMTSAASAQNARGDTNLRARLQTLAKEHGFRLHGADRIDTIPPADVSGSLRERISALLAQYNFIILMAGRDRVAEVLVTGRVGPRVVTPEEMTLKTTRRGTSHYVEAVIFGRQSESITVSLMIDTGASMVVLPSSMLEKLGYQASELREMQFDTSNGKVMGRVAMLAKVELGHAIASNVAVAFLDDKNIGDKMLLGMSFLGRFVMTMDDAKNELRLEPRQAIDKP